MYKHLGYIVCRIVLEYYSGDPDEGSVDMRKALSRDVKKKSVIPLTHPVRPEEVKIQFLYISIVLFDMFIKACILFLLSFLSPLDQGHTIVPYSCKVHFHT
jgi:hypothetical protein